MLETLTRTLSHVYTWVKPKTLPLIALPLIFGPGCKFSLRTGTVPAVTKQPSKILYERLFHYMEKNGIDIFVDSMIKDFQDTGEHAGAINIKDGKIEIKPSQANGEFEQYKKAISNLRQGKASHKDIIILENFLCDRPDVTLGIVATLNKLARKNDPKINSYLADIFESFVDASGRLKDKGDICYHFHPISSMLSPVDVRNAAISGFLPLAFSYDQGFLRASYLDQGRIKALDPKEELRRRSFRIKDPEKVFQLDLLVSKIYSKRDFSLFAALGKDNNNRHHNALYCFDYSLLYLNRAVTHYLKQSKAGKKDPKKEKQLDQTILSLSANLTRKIKHLDQTKEIFGKDQNHQEACQRYNQYAQKLKKIVDRYKPQPKKEEPKPRFPWEIPAIGVSALALVGAAGYLFHRRRKQHQYRRRA